MGFVVGGIVLVVVAVVVILTVLRRKQAAGYAGADTYRKLMGVDGGKAAATDPEVEKLRQNLRVKYLYQEDKIDAAIELERERMPSGSQAQLMNAAIERWERDNR